MPIPINIFIWLRVAVGILVNFGISSVKKVRNTMVSLGDFKSCL